MNFSSLYLKIEKMANKKEGEEDSDDDDLNGWCYRKY